MKSKCETMWHHMKSNKTRQNQVTPCETTGIIWNQMKPNDEILEIKWTQISSIQIIEIHNMKSHGIEWKQVTQHKNIELWPTELKSSEISGSNWNHMKSAEAKWNKMKPSESKWSQMKSRETNWNQQVNSKSSRPEAQWDPASEPQANPGPLPPQPPIQPQLALSVPSCRYCA